MTYSEFTEALRGTRGLGKWEVVGGKFIRLKLGEGTKSPGNSLCPIAAVALHTQGKLIGNMVASRGSANGLGLSNTSGIVVAADSLQASGPNREVRKDLLSATGISPDGCEPVSCGCK